MLQELNQLKINAKERVDSNLAVELNYTQEVKEKILAMYIASFPKYSAQLQDGLIKIKNDKNQTAYLPFNWFSRIRYCQHLIEALMEYSVYVDQLKTILSDSTMRDLPKICWETTLSPEDSARIIEFLNEKFDEASDREKFKKFLDGRVWLDNKENDDNLLTGKKLNRQSSDYIGSCITSICKLINDTAGKLEQFIKLYIDFPDVRNMINNQLPVDETILFQKKLSVKGVNFIYYGAPGTGKSHQLNELTEGNRKIVTVFHPDTQNSDFIGSLKPTNVSGSVTYAFRPGPFTTALLEALKNPEQNVYLVIEEINRAPAAAVFGELFQLLDRENGASKYEIDFTDPDMQAYINDELKAVGLDERSKLSIPANLSLLATMNSSDQAVMPLDTAFKRRWSFRYMKLDFENPAVSSQNLRIMTTQGVYYITWKDFANKVVNHQLKEMKVPEDRLIGPFFLNSTELSNSETSNEAISGKLFVYLWDDVLRHKGRNIIFDKNIGTFGELHEQFIEGKKPVFSEVIESLIISNGNTADDTTGVTEGDE
ncbi:AAA family ATPase [Providencia alcalifaciens]|uniref:AAA family ATPase n=1 Tax=Providencia alcalifaciens TaxID=126385 RepID=UPI0032DB3B0B